MSGDIGTHKVKMIEKKGGLGDMKKPSLWRTDKSIEVALTLRF